MSVSRLLVGLAIGAGAVAVALYARKVTAQGALAGSELGARETLPGENVVYAPEKETDGAAAAHNVAAAAHAAVDTAQTAAESAQGAANAAVDSARSTTSTVQRRANDLLATVKAYIASARAQLDLAIAEGKATAAQTRLELEARFEQAKRDPDSAKTAFM